MKLGMKTLFMLLKIFVSLFKKNNISQLDLTFYRYTKYTGIKKDFILYPFLINKDKWNPPKEFLSS